jgi:hypothetical protein
MSPWSHRPKQEPQRRMPAGSRIVRAGTRAQPARTARCGPLGVLRILKRSSLTPRLVAFVGQPR